MDQPRDVQGSAQEKCGLLPGGQLTFADSTTLAPPSSFLRLFGTGHLHTTDLAEWWSPSVIYNSFSPWYACQSCSFKALGIKGALANVQFVTVL